MKKCIKCDKEKNESEFYKQVNKNLTIGTCKTCHKKIMTNWQKKNPEKCKKAWTKFNRKRRKGRICQWCGSNYKISTSQKECSIPCRFNNNIEKKDNGCWHWKKKGASKMGYGVVSIERRNIPAHRFSFEYHYGKIPKDKMICHTCDNPICVNPNHLYLGTHQENMNDMNTRGRGNKNRWHHRKYSREKCLDVIRLRSEGKLYKEISTILEIKESACKFIYKNPQRLEENKFKE